MAERTPSSTPRADQKDLRSVMREYEASLRVVPLLKLSSADSSLEIEAFMNVLKERLLAIERDVETECRMHKRRVIARVLVALAAELERSGPEAELPRDSLTASVFAEPCCTEGTSVDSKPDTVETLDEQFPVKSVRRGSAPEMTRKRPSDTSPGSRKRQSVSDSAFARRAKRSTEATDPLVQECAELIDQVRHTARWNAYAWMVLCRRPELEALGLKGNNIMAVCGREWEELQKDLTSFKPWLESILEFVREHEPPADAKGKEITAYKEAIAHALPSPYRGRLTKHAAAFSHAN